MLTAQNGVNWQHMTMCGINLYSAPKISRGVEYVLPQPACPYYSGLRRTVVDARTVEKIICQHVNSERSRCGHDRPRFSRACAGKVRAHAGEMRRRNYFAHVSPSGKDWNAGGRTPECIVMLQGMGGRSDAAVALEVVRTWKGSTPHYDAILKASGFLGAGVAMGMSGRIYAVL